MIRSGPFHLPDGCAYHCNTMVTSWWSLEFPYLYCHLQEYCVIVWLPIHDCAHFCGSWVILCVSSAPCRHCRVRFLWLSIPFLHSERWDAYCTACLLVSTSSSLFEITVTLTCCNFSHQYVFLDVSMTVRAHRISTFFFTVWKYLEIGSPGACLCLKNQYHRTLCLVLIITSLFTALSTSSMFRLTHCVSLSFTYSIQYTEDLKSKTNTHVAQHQWPTTYVVTDLHDLKATVVSPGIQFEDTVATLSPMEPDITQQPYQFVTI